MANPLKFSLPSFAAAESGGNIVDLAEVRTSRLWELNTAADSVDRLVRGTEEAPIISLEEAHQARTKRERAQKPAAAAIMETVKAERTATVGHDELLATRLERETVQARWDEVNSAGKATDEAVEFKPGEVVVLRPHPKRHILGPLAGNMAAEMVYLESLRAAA